MIEECTFKICDESLVKNSILTYAKATPCINRQELIYEFTKLSIHNSNFKLSKKCELINMYIIQLDFTYF